MAKKSAVLLLAYGTPDTLADIPAFLLDIRGGRPVSAELMGEMTKRYEAIGGVSPLTTLTMEQASAVQALLARRGADLPVYVGMRHWKPWIATTLQQMMADGVEHTYTLILAPHACTYTETTYQKALDNAAGKIGCTIQFTPVGPWSRQPELIAAQQDVTQAALATVPEQAKTKTVFSAHSLPTRILDNGDPYADDLLANAKAIAASFPGLDWMFAYQSAGAYGGPWIGPDVNEAVANLAESGYEAMVSVPIGFVCDHLEILFDLDIETRQLAEAKGMSLHRAAAMNSHPRFIAAIVDAILAKRD